MKKYIIEYESYDSVLSLLGSNIPHTHLDGVKSIILDLTEEEYEALTGAGIKVTEDYVPNLEKAMLSYPSHVPFRTYPLFTGGINSYLKIPEAHLAGFNGNGIKLALLDTGCQPSNQALCSPTLILQDYTGFGTGDLYSHGSKACMVTSQRYSFFSAGLEVKTGMAYGATVYSMNVLLGGVSGIITAINYCIANGIDIINISLDFGGDMLTTAIQSALDAGIIVVCASGNDLSLPMAHPANVPGVIAVSCVDVTIGGDPVKGSYITTDGSTGVTIVNYNGGHYEFFAGGTSQAAWALSSLLAIYKQKYPSLNCEKAINLLRRKAIPIDGYTYNVKTTTNKKLVNYETGAGFLAPLY